MPEGEDYRLYLQGEFKNLHQKLDDIKSDTGKTNSRVDHLEDDVNELKLRNVEHLIECPVKPRVRAIEKDLEEYHFMKNYPKAIVTIIAVVVIGIVFGLYKTLHSFSGKVEGIEDQITKEIRLMDGVSKESRDGTVRYRDLMGFTDSINVR